MRILKHGTLSPSVFITECHKCGCVAQWEHSEVYAVYSQVVLCPECKFAVVAKVVLVDEYKGVKREDFECGSS